MRGLCALLFVGFVLSAAFAQPDQRGFVPGHIYITQNVHAACLFGVPEHIIEIDPDTGEFWVLADSSSSGVCAPAGLVFTPDGTRLRVANFLIDQILDLDPIGNSTVKYDWRDGLSGPGYKNGMTFDEFGDFYLVNEYADMLKFENDFPPGQVFAGLDDGVSVSGTIHFHPDGRLFVTQSRSVRMLDGDGNGVVFEHFGSGWGVYSLLVVPWGDLYVWARDRDDNDILYWYPGAVAASKQEVLRLPPSGGDVITMALSLDRSEIFVMHDNNAKIYGVDLTTYALRVIYEAPFDTYFGSGIAVFVPPPVTAFGPGDMNCDGSVNAFDIDPFVLALIDTEDYAATYPACQHGLADVNANGTLNTFDIQPFIELISP